MVSLTKDFPRIEKLRNSGVKREGKIIKHCKSCKHEIVNNDCKPPKRNTKSFKNMEMEECWERRIFKKKTKTVSELGK